MDSGRWSHRLSETFQFTTCTPEWLLYVQHIWYTTHVDFAWMLKFPHHLHCSFARTSWICSCCILTLMWWHKILNRGNYGLTMRKGLGQTSMYICVTSSRARRGHFVFDAWAKNQQDTLWYPGQDHDMIHMWCIVAELEHDDNTCQWIQAPMRTSVIDTTDACIKHKLTLALVDHTGICMPCCLPGQSFQIDYLTTKLAASAGVYLRAVAIARFLLIQYCIQYATLQAARCVQWLTHDWDMHYLEIVSLVWDDSGTAYVKQ